MIDAAWFYSEDVIDREIIKMLAYAGDYMRTQNVCFWAKSKFAKKYPHLTRESKWWERVANCEVAYDKYTVAVYIGDKSEQGDLL